MKFSTAFSLLCTSVLAKTVAGDSIAALASATPDLSTLVTALGAADLVGAVDGSGDGGPLTVMAPTNAAFDALPEGVVAKLLEPEWVLHLTDVLTYHVVDGNVTAGMLALGPVTMLNMQDIEISQLTPTVMINDAATVTTANVMADNGVVHIIDQVLLPASATMNAVEMGKSSPDFSTLMELVALAGLEEALSGPGPFSILAPTNDAFAKLDAETVASLKLPENKDQLATILKYHVHDGMSLPSPTDEGKTYTTLAGINTPPLSMMDDSPMMGDAMLGDASLASNGIIYPIDMVMLPPDDAGNTTSAPAGNGATTAPATNASAASSMMAVSSLVAASAALGALVL